ncbi:hypothetical protein L9F63_028128 [Diploptera punctata]|uniref:Uncharacterized protein n=1 Tax=Diploptera punctata TaxID=6984 RepID=A0AAD8EFL2_DIPPU|nr:hypothetical protein L9F63_028128 [Diploptera punctata]
MFDWQPHSNDSVHSMGSMMVDEDYMEFMTDTLFSTIQQNQPFAFPDPREISQLEAVRTFIQPSLVQLQPNLEDLWIRLKPLQDLLSAKLPSVPEECVPDDMFRGRGMGGAGYLELDPLSLEPSKHNSSSSNSSKYNNSRHNKQAVP